MHWSLRDLRDMAFDEYTELLSWAQDKSKDSDPDSTDADAIVEARQAKERKDRAGEDDELDG